MDNQTEDLKLEKDGARLSQTRREKNANRELEIQEKKLSS